MHASGERLRAGMPDDAAAGWPALSMLVSVKLLSAMFDHDKDDQRTVPDFPGTVRRTGRDDAAQSGTIPAQRTTTPAPSATGPAHRPADPIPGQSNASGDADHAHIGDPGTRAAAPLDTRTVAHLIPAARAARATLANDGRSLSRDHLADAMRVGYGVSNAI